jgi:ligand-binding sensor domain-containing protein/serine phosphatase RsbU (regulator of sigma subunit)
MQGRKIIFLCFCILFISYFNSFSQYAVKNFYSLSGKKDVSFNCIAQDANGYLWLGTNEGVIRFDGIKSEFYKKENGISDLKITSIFVDASQTVWAGTENGKVYWIKNKKLDSLKFEKAPSSKITAFYSTPNKKLFVGTYGDGIYIFDNNRTEHLTSENGLADNVIYNMHFANNQLWCGTDAGITVISNLGDKPTFKIISHQKGLPDNIVRNISSMNKERFIISMQDSGFCFYNVKAERFEKPTFINDWSHGPVINAEVFGENSFAIATEKKGLFIIENGQFFIQDYNSTAKTNSANFLFKDKNTDLWLASPKGLHQYSQKRFNFINNAKGLANEKILSVVVDDDKTILAGTETGAVQITYDPSGKLLFIPNEPLSKFTISCATNSPDGEIWLGTYSNGIVILKNAKTKFINLNSKTGGLSNDNISNIYFSNQNTAYISTLGGGLIEMEISGEPENKTYKVKRTFTEADGLASQYIYASITDGKGNLFAATDGGGLQIFRNDKFRSLTKQYNLSSQTVFSLCKDDRGSIWASSNLNGILKYNGKEIETLTQKKNGLRDEQPAQLIAYDNIIYSIHSKGIDKINSNDNSISYFDVFEGDLEPNLNSAFVKDGILYSGTNNGLLIYRLAKQTADTVKPIAIIDQLQINYQNFSLDSLHEFKYNQNNISFGFDGIWLKNPEKLSYRFKLEGFEDKWNYSNEGKLVNYNNLSAGHYQFIVQSKNEEDVWSNESIFSFNILAPIWAKWWFWAIVVIVVGSCIYLFLQYRLKALQKENIVLEEKVAERTHEIELQTKIIEAKSKELELLSLVASKTDNVVLILDSEGRLEYVNESFVRLNRITFEDLKKQGETIFEISNNPKIRELVDEAVGQRKSMKYEALNKIDNNTEVWEASTLTPIFDENGKLKKIIIIDSDVTESKRQERIIFQKNKDITDSIEYARKIQTAILPEEKLIKKHLPDSFVLYKTKDIVSGDFYWFAEKEDCCIIAAVDCTGHGVPGAFMSLIGYNILNKIVNEQGISEPGEILKHLNKGVLDALYKNQIKAESKDGMDIAICKIPYKGNQIQYAGSMRPIWIANANGVNEIKGDKIPIGTIPGIDKPDYTFVTHHITLQKDDVVYIFTDGYSDQFGGEREKKFSTTRFKEILSKNYTLPFDKQHDVLWKEHLNWKGNLEQIDDILVIGYRLG